jgi:hypothetical protein
MPVSLRSDFDPAALRSIARKSKDGPRARRLLALAAIDEGATRTEAARIGGVTLQIVRDWVVKFNAHGPEGLINRRWAKRGTRPSYPKDQRTASASIFGAICPAQGKGAALVLPRCTTEAMTLQLAEIAQAVAPGAHAIVLPETLPVR